MIKIISECNDFMKCCGFSYAICGGYALELYCGKKIRTHGDVDLIVFEEDRTKSVEYVLKKGWNIYEHHVDWVDNKKTNNWLRLITDPNDETLPKLKGVWALKPDCTLIDIKMKSNVKDTYDYKITNNEQLKFDFFEINFNKRENGNFVFDSFNSQGKYITRELDKAVLYTCDGIPYLSLEVKLFMNSHPAYLKSDYHRDKSILDFDTIAPLLAKESREWLINALETAYPDGLERLNRLKI